MRRVGAVFVLACATSIAVAAEGRESSGLRLDAVEPGQVSALGGTEITIRGAGFTPEVHFRIGRLAVVRPQVSRDGTTVRALASPLPEGEALGARDLVAQLGRTTAVLARAVTYVQPPDDPVQRGVDRLRLQSKRPASLRFQRGRLRSAILRVPVTGDGPAQRARGFLDAHRELFGLDQPHQQMVLRKVDRDEDGEGVAFQQTYRGIPVYGGTLKVVMSDRHVFSVMGSLLRPNAHVDERPQLGPAAAEAAARLALRRPSAPLLAPTQLAVFDRSLFVDEPSDPALVWQVTLGGGMPWRLLVDAKTGVVRHRVRRLFESGGALHGFDFDLQDAEDEANSIDDSCFNLSDDTDVADEGWYNGDYTLDMDARAVDLYARQAYAFFHENFGRHSYDGDFAQVGAWVHSTTTGGAAFNEFCGSLEFSTGSPNEDTVTHEFTHGVVAYTSELEYEFGSGALNESYADVMGVLQDRAYGNGSFLFGTTYYDLSDNWTYAEDRTGGGINEPSRSLVDPTAYGQPNHADGFTWGMKDGDGNYPDNGNVHFNSGIPNHAKYLMAVGGTHESSGVVIRPADDPPALLGLAYPTRAIGEFKMKRLAWSALKYLDPNSNLTDARDYEVARAADWAKDGTWGFTPEDACTVTWAYAAVGLGLGDADCDGVGDSPGIPDTDGDGVPNTEDNCIDDFNPFQANNDNDPAGDTCDPNDDNDPWADAVDLCDLEWNPNNSPCGDADADGVPNEIDNCGEYNPDQTDSDGNGFADACDADMDGDGLGVGDNCPLLFNPFQLDSDGDLFGNACDKCPDTAESPVSFLPNGWPNQPDSDGDGTPDACDDSLKVLTAGVAGQAQLTSDAQVRTVDVEGRSGTFQQVHLEVCPDGCDEARAGLREIALSVAGLEPGVIALVHDDKGRAVAKEKRRRSGERRLTFRPQGGRRYVLTLGFTSGFGERRASPFTVKVVDKDGDRGR